MNFVQATGLSSRTQHEQEDQITLAERLKLARDRCGAHPSGDRSIIEQRLTPGPS